MINSAAYETFRTISAVQGNFARLAYLASLQDAPGRYQHWGLAKEYGEDEVCQAFRRSHRLVLETVLQTDISELLGDLSMGAESHGQNLMEFLQYLQSTPLVRTTGWPLHSHTHFNFLMESLRCLALARG